MKNEKYYVGFDIGTDSVGYAVTDEQYNLCKFRGEPMWGVNIFEEAQLAVDRRNFRVARRRLDRRQQRIDMIRDIFAEEIYKVDKNFYKRLKESYLYPNTADEKVRLFDSYGEQRSYDIKYPTIHHLIFELMQSKDIHDVRHIYIACAWLVAHRGHFLSDVSKNNIEEVTDFGVLYKKLINYIKRDGRILPWNDNIDINLISSTLNKKTGITKKAKALTEVLFNGEKAPKVINDEYEFNYELLIKLLCGAKVGLKELFGREEYEDLDEKSIMLGMDDDKLSAIMQNIGEDADIISILKSIYDWAILIDVLKGKTSISEAKVEVYEQHKRDLKSLKYFIKKYLHEKYDEIFRSKTQNNNYVAYVGKNKTKSEDIKVKKSNSQEDLCKYLLSIFKNISPETNDFEEYQKITNRLEINDFLPKQVDGDNRVIPFQLYLYELNKILDNAQSYLPILSKVDENGLTGVQKIISVFEFRVPYYVGPLKENLENNKKINCWMKRKAEGKIYPWNFKDMVDLDASEELFIKRMTNSCTYLPGEDVLPKNSLIYCAFEVLNEINKIKINGVDISVEAKQGIYENVFMQFNKVTPKKIKHFLVANGYACEEDIISGLDITIKSSLIPFRLFRNLVEKELLSYSDVEAIIKRATYSEDKVRLCEWLHKEYPKLPDNEIKYILSMKFKDFGRLSRKLLCSVEGTNKQTGERFTILRAMWETNYNFMELCSNKFTFAEEIDNFVKVYYDINPKKITDIMDDMGVSNAVKRPIIRTLDIIKDVVKVKGNAPEMIFIEMARGTIDNQKGKRTDSRLKQICDLYSKIDTEEVRELQTQLDELGETVHNKLQSDKLFLYFIQLGKCLYTGKPIDIESIIKGDGKFNIEHIYPRSFVKDDSIINNLILVDSKANGDKSDTFPISSQILNNMSMYWAYLNKIGLLSDEKLKRLSRKTPFTDDEKFEFTNRQLVETRQSTKAIGALLKEMYPNSEIVYVKAGLISDFRDEFNILKSRTVNDLHHAKDAYLNIVVGNVWHHKFSKQFWKADSNNNAKHEVVFSRTIKCGDKTIWRGVEDKNRIVNTVKKNTPRLTKYAFCRKGGFFDQNPVSSAEGLVSRKKTLPSEIYGGYNKTTASFFVLVKYKVGKKQDIFVMPIELLYADKFVNDNTFALEYARKTIGGVLGKPVDEIDFLLNKRFIKINTILSLNGLNVCITGKSGGGRQLGVSLLESYKTSFENECYIKKLESFENKRRRNSNIILSEAYDGISKDKNNELYDNFISKFNKPPFMYRPANPIDTLMNKKEEFKRLSPDRQVSVLLQILGLFGRAPSADLTDIGGVAKAGAAKLSSNVSNWKKNYTDVRIIDKSSSGLYETVSENIINLL